jgi:hypothetical protein
VKQEMVILSDPLTIKGLTLKSRIVMPPMATDFATLLIFVIFQLSIVLLKGGNIRAARSAYVAQRGISNVK